VIAVSDQEETVAAIPLNVTGPWVVLKYFPLTVTVVPIFPEAGAREEIIGGFTVKVLPADAPTEFVTTTGTAPAVTPVGTATLMVVSVHEAYEVTGTPPTVTLDEPWVAPKYLPLMVTDVPAVPKAGAREEVRGRFTVKVLPADVPAVVVTSTGKGPALTPSGTATLMVVSVHEAYEVTGTPPMVTLDEPWVAPKYLPLMVTDVPAAPKAGAREEIIGGLRAKVAATVQSTITA
jgi:hypothetical protein